MGSDEAKSTEERGRERGRQRERKIKGEKIIAEGKKQMKDERILESRERQN